MLLVRHPGTEATRAARVPRDEPATGTLPDLTAWLGRSGQVLRSPAARCHYPGASVEPALGPWDLGSWEGHLLSEIGDLPAWRLDPSFARHGGESLIDIQTRVADWLDQWHARPGRWAAITHAAVIRAAVTHVLRAPPEAAWDLDVAPNSITELHTTASGWRVVRVSSNA